MAKKRFPENDTAPDSLAAGPAAKTRMIWLLSRAAAGGLF